MSSSDEFIERVKAAPLEQVHQWAAAYLQMQASRRGKNSKHCASDKSKTRYRRYYFTSNDIYHPQLNPGGTHEKKWKRVAERVAERFAKQHALSSTSSSAAAPTTLQNNLNVHYSQQKLATENSSSCSIKGDTCVDSQALQQCCASCERRQHKHPNSDTSVLSPDSQVAALHQRKWRFAAKVIQAVEAVAIANTHLSKICEEAAEYADEHSELIEEADALTDLLDSRFQEARLPMEPVDVRIVDLLPRIRTLLTKFVSCRLFDPHRHKHICTMISQLETLD